SRQYDYLCRAGLGENNVPPSHLSSLRIAQDRSADPDYTSQTHGGQGSRAIRRSSIEDSEQATQVANTSSRRRLRRTLSERSTAGLGSSPEISSSRLRKFLSKLSRVLSGPTASRARSADRWLYARRQVPLRSSIFVGL